MQAPRVACLSFFMNEKYRKHVRCLLFHSLITMYGKYSISMQANVMDADALDHCDARS